MSCTTQTGAPGRVAASPAGAHRGRRYREVGNLNRLVITADKLSGVSEPGGQNFYVGAVEPARGEEIQVALVFGSQG